ncbi:ribosome-binding factor A [Urbifossiella limnaea]|uniref:ribosome-binding factor A n=1 Tax=Urbifossiella limnaea TaxID=2528023 RepID=UPI0011A0E429|nr:ribosome-binding factor A [Urbifossiella limnaea]
MTDELGPEDGTDPKDWHRKPWNAPRGAGRKAHQLCRQVAEVLHAAVGGCADPVVQPLTVAYVTPAPHTGRLRVTTMLPADGSISRTAAEAGLARAAGRLRGEVAAVVNRRHAPELVFEVV